MKMIIAFFLLLPFSSFSQNNTNKFYINPNLVLRKSIQWNSPIAGANLTGGVIIKNFGIGAGVDYFKVYSDIKAATPVFADLRYFFRSDKTNVLLPYAALDAGKMIWSATQVNGVAVDNFTTGYKGKSYLGIEFGLFLVKGKQSGFSAAAGFKNYPVTRSGIHRTTLRADGSTGPLVETKYADVTDQHSEIFLKLGYSF